MPKTIKVRIAVAVNEKGQYIAEVDGCRSMGPAEHALWCVQRDEEERPMAASVHWITAELPVPEAQEVEGRVEP